MRNLLFLLLTCSCHSFSQSGLTRVDSVAFFFGHAKWEVSHNGSAVKRLKNLMENNASVVIEIRGFTDTVGTAEYNRYLADFRMKAVKNELEASGLKIAKYTIKGESAIAGKPLSANRRVDVLAYSTVQRREKERQEPVIPVKVMNEDEPVRALNEPAEESRQIEPEEMKEIELNVPVVLSIEFLNATAVIMDYSYREVDMLFFVLLDHPEYTVELHGHVCCIDAYETSLERARAVQTALMRKGIKKERISVFGHSNKEPLFEEVDEESEQRNRRVEAVFRAGK